MPIAEASKLMKDEKIHRLPVLDKNKNLVGIISEKDILYASPSPASSLSIHEMAYLLSKITVKQLMSKNVVTITKDTTVEEAARLMVDQDLSCLPVLEDGKLVGIVSKSDMFKILLELFGARHFGVRVSFLVTDHPGTIAKDFPGALRAGCGHHRAWYVHGNRAEQRDDHHQGKVHPQAR
jgi:acetoin utilization protein AcuB